MKKACAFALLLALVLSVFPAIAIENAVTIMVDGTAMQFPDAQPYIDDHDRTMVPISIFAEYLNMETNWNQDTQTALFLSMQTDLIGDYLRMTIGKNEIEKGIFDKLSAIGFYPKTTIEMDTVAVLKEDRTFVPLRFVAQNLGFAVTWDEDAKCVNLIHTSQNGFDFSLLQYMPKDQNYLLSPYSLKMALVMAANGADGKTKQEILDVLGIADLDQFNASARDFIVAANQNDKVSFNVANSIWQNTDVGGADLDFSSVYKKTIGDYFFGTAAKINNQNGAKTINDWIAAQTNDKITDMVTDDTVKNSVSFLVNALYFKGAWFNAFDADSTTDNVFTDREGKQTITAFMCQTKRFGYYEDEQFQMMGKPYEDTNIKMYIVLPKTDAPLSQGMLEYAIKNMKFEDIALSLPKFETEILHDNLVDILSDMGIKNAFNKSSADFSNLYSDKMFEAYIDSILQKAFIAVDEDGTEAAAATVITVAPTSVGPITTPPIPFKCDRPFTYFIRNDATGDILFMGEYAYTDAAAPPAKVAAANTTVCPNCGSENTLPIQYGLPSPDMFEQSKNGDIFLGGCIISPDSPTHYCKDCKQSFGTNNWFSS